MTCPDCGGKTLVMDSRADKLGVYRKRKCASCGEVYYTVEAQTSSAKKYYNKNVAEYYHLLRIKRPPKLSKEDNHDVKT